MNLRIVPPSGSLTFTSGDPPTVTVAPAGRPVAPVVVLQVRARPVARRTELIHGPPLAA